jgi:hypothetical protein
MPSTVGSITAPHASIAIPLHLSSITGLRHRTLNCLECGQPFLERNTGQLYRLHDTSRPELVRVAGQAIPATCGRCSQTYQVHISLEVTYDVQQPLHSQAQSIVLVPSSIKHSRYLYCLECGKKFHGMADRISIVSDNMIPLEHISQGRMGPLEALCSSKHCRQVWALMV